MCAFDENASKLELTGDGCVHLLLGGSGLCRAPASQVIMEFENIGTGDSEGWL